MGEIIVQNRVLKFWDLGGQDALQPIWEKYYKDCHGIIFVVDSTDTDRLEQVQKTCLKVAQDKDCGGVPILMLANKQDIENAMRLEQIKQVFNPIAEKLDSTDSKVLEVCALTGKGVKEAINWIFPRLLKSQRLPIRK